MISRLYDTINNKLSCDFKLHIGLMVTDKLVIVLPVDVMDKHCSEVFDLVHSIFIDLGIPKKDINNYIEYQSAEKVSNKENICWYNQEES